MQNDQINKRLDSVDKRFDSVDKKFDEVNTHLNTMTIGFLSIVGILVTGLLGIISKLVFFPMCKSDWKLLMLIVYGFKI